MDRRPSQLPSTADGGPTDGEIADLVRSVAGGWTMPPTAIETSWQDRVRTVSARSWGSGRMRRLIGQVGRAAALAAAATVALALVAVWLSLPRTPPAGAGASLPGLTISPPTPEPTPTPTSASRATPSAAAATQAPSAPAPTGLPTYARFGGAVAPSQIVVGTGTGYARLDLSNGTLGQPFVGSVDTYAMLFARPDGQLVSLAPTTVISPGSDGVAGKVKFFDSTGTPTGSFTARTYLGRPDPAVKIPGTSVVSASQGASAELVGTLSPDGTQLYIGWAVRLPPAWQAGVDVVDLASRTIVQTIHLPGAPSSVAGSASYDWAPTVTLSPGGSQLVILGTTVDGAGAASSQRWSASVDGGRVGALRPFAGGPGTLADCFATVSDEGFATATTYYAVCTPGGDASTPPVLRRVDLGGRPLGDTPLASTAAGAFAAPYGHLIERATATYYAWDPFAGVLIRLDLATGKITGMATIPKSTAGSNGPLGIIGSIGDQLGRWLAPDAAAKMYLQPALAVSPDGTRLYLLGTTATSLTDSGAGSTGVWVVDARSLAMVDHWAPTADFISIAVSPDGASVYAAGMPDNDAAGNQTGQDASVTVYQAASGQVTVIAGRLGQGYLDLAPATP